MRVERQIVSLPDQVIYRAIVLGWYDYSNPKMLPVYSDGIWETDLEPGYYGVMYFGAKKQPGPQPYVWPRQDAVHFDFSQSSAMTVPVGTVDFTFDDYPNCQAVCHGPYYFTE